MIQRIVILTSLSLLINNVHGAQQPKGTPSPSTTIQASFTSIVVSAAVSTITTPFRSNRSIVAAAIKDKTFVTKYSSHVEQQNALNLAFTEATTKAIAPNEHNRVGEMLSLAEYAKENGFSYTPQLRKDALEALKIYEDQAKRLRVLLEARDDQKASK